MSIWRLSDSRDSDIIRLMFTFIGLGSATFLIVAGLLPEENRRPALIFGGIAGVALLVCLVVNVKRLRKHSTRQ